MGEQILLLRLEGPLQSWGERSRWDVRDTGDYPTKSGVVGLLGCALGYTFGDARLQTELDAGLRMAVRADQPGEKRDDFQTISGFLPMASGGFKHREGTSSRSYDPVTHAGLHEATIVSPRTYLEDAAFLVALGLTSVAPRDLLVRCESALQKPAWPIFLGRRCCVPTRPVYETLTDQFNGLEEAIRNYPWSVLGADTKTRIRKITHLDYEIEDIAGAQSRQDRLQVNEARLYGFRRVRRVRTEISRQEGETH